MRAVVFDMDDTLFPEAAFVRGGLRAAGAWLEAVAGLPTGRATTVFLDVLEGDGPFRVFDVGLARLGLDRTPEVVQGLVRTYRDHPPVLAPHLGVPVLLDALRARGVRLALVTDGYEDVQRRKWAALGLQDRFDVAIDDDDVPNLHRVVDLALYVARRRGGSIAA
jgi:putative hydrolase of the HAD superfamily